MISHSSALNMARCLLDPHVGLKDGAHSPQHVGHMIGDVFHYKGVPSARAIGDRILVRVIPYGMPPGTYLPKPPDHMWGDWDSRTPEERAGLTLLRTRLTPKPNTLAVQNLNPESLFREVETYEENLLVYLTESVAGKFGRTRFANTHNLKRWLKVLAHNRQAVRLPELSVDELKVRFAPSVAAHQLRYPTYADLDWKKILS